MQLLYRKSYAEKVQEVEKDPKIPVSFRNAVQKIGITITGIISSEIVIIDFQYEAFNRYMSSRIFRITYDKVQLDIMPLQIRKRSIKVYVILNC